MLFLQPVAFWGLLALAVPIIVHFFNLQRPRVLLFSNVALIREVKRTVVKRLQFRRWLVLLMRLLAIAAAVLAFANPVPKAAHEAAQEGRSVAIVIDNSLSMTAGNERGPYLQQAKSLANTIANALAKRDEILVMPTSALRLNYAFGDRAAALQNVADITPQQTARTHAEVLALRQDLFARAHHLSRELYFISDFQLATVMADTAPGAPTPDASVATQYIPLATRPQQNAYIQSHQFLSQIVEQGKPVQMRMTLVNDSETPLKDLNIRVLLDSQVVAIATQSLAPQRQAALELSFTPPSPGWHAGVIELNDSPNDFDNRRYFTLYVPHREKILVAEAQPNPALKVLYRDLFQQFQPTFVTDKTLASVQLTDYKAVILIGLADISAGLAGRLQALLDNGGSLMFIPGERLNLGAANACFQAIGAGAWQPLRTSPTPLPADRVDLAHPIFSGVFAPAQQNRAFDAPAITRFYPFQPSPGSIHTPIMAFATGEPMLLETRSRSGLIYTFTTFPADAWGDWHLKSAFAPLMLRATQRMCQSAAPAPGQTLGAPQPLQQRTPRKDMLQLRAPGGQAFLPEQYPQPGGIAVVFDKLALAPGNYDLTQGDSLLQKIAFNAADPESKLAYADAPALRQALSRTPEYAGVDVIPPKVDILAAEVQRAQQGTPLWKWFVALALAALIAEIALLRWRQ